MEVMLFSLENQVKILQNELLFEQMNRVPIGHVQVCKSVNLLKMLLFEGCLFRCY